MIDLSVWDDTPSPKPEDSHYCYWGELEPEVNKNNPWDGFDFDDD